MTAGSKASVAPTTFASATINGPVNTAAYAAFTEAAVVSGAAVTPNATSDSLVNVNVAATTVGTVTVTYGPVTGAENVWCPSTALLAGMGESIALRVPAGWKMVVTLTGVTVTATLQSHRI